MQVFKNVDQVRRQHFQETVLTLGSFDGIHLGHRQLLKRMVQEAPLQKKVVLTFDPHPAKVLSQQPPPLLFSAQDQIQVFTALGVDVLFLMPFDQGLAQMNAADFVKNVIWDLFRPQCVVVGYDFSFGKDRLGNALFLQEQLSSFHVQVYQEPSFRNGADVVSSTLIRRLVAQGQIERVQVLLDRPYYLEGVVIEGRKLGRTIGFPTANLKCDNEIFPGTGVYYCQTLIRGQTYKAVGNVGFNPTVSNNHNLKIEFHVLDFHGDLYGQFLRFEFLKKLRDEKKFESKDALRAQIQADVEQARHF